MSELPLYSWEEIRKHNKDKDCWVVLYKNVLDVTAFLNHHPGGLDPINDLGGYDITNSFESIGHSKFAEEKAKKFIIGRVDPKSIEPVPEKKKIKFDESCRTFKLSDDPFKNVRRFFYALVVLIIAYYASQLLQ